jgi:hypothetical protein
MMMSEFLTYPDAAIEMGGRLLEPDDGALRPTTIFEQLARRITWSLGLELGR